MNNPFLATECPIQYGNWEGPADTTRGITLDTTKLGNMYYSVGMGSGTAQTNKPRIIMLVKNDSGATLSPCLVVAHKTTTITGKYLIAGLAGALSLVVAGVVEDGYINGVPDGAIFRMVIEGEHYLQIKTSADALSATIVGQALCAAGSGEVTGQDNSVAAGAATFAQINSVVGQQMTVTANSAADYGLKRLAYVKIPKVI
jgi:hypothetical protein